MASKKVEDAITSLLSAEKSGERLSKLTDNWPDLDLETAYLIQDNLVARKVTQGDTIVGHKLGLTSRAKQERMGVNSPLTAVLLASHLAPADKAIATEGLTQPRIEPEIAFVMGKDLRGPNVTAAQALDAVSSVHAAFEVIDSRFMDYQFNLPDVTADNASAAYFVIAPHGVPPRDANWAQESVAFSHNGTVIYTATGAAVQGHPAEALAMAANDLWKRGQSISAGEIVLSGALTDAIPIAPGDHVSAQFDRLGLLALSIK